MMFGGPMLARTPGGPSIVQSAQTTTDDTDSHSISMPSGIVANDLLLCFFSIHNNSSLSASGWTKVKEQSSTNLNVKNALFSRTANGSSDSMTVSSGESGRAIARVYRIANANAVYANSKAQYTALNTITMPTVSPAATGRNGIALLGISRSEDGDILTLPDGLGNKSYSNVGSTISATYGYKSFVTENWTPASFSSTNDSEWNIMLAVVYGDN